MNYSKIGDPASSNHFEALASSELTSVDGGNSIAMIGVPFLIGCVIGDALWGDRPTMSVEQWFNTYMK